MQDLRRRASGLADLIGERTGVRGSDLKSRLNRLGRALPKALRRDGDEILSALQLLDHPRLASRLDGGKIDAAFSRLEKHFKAIDPFDRRLGKALSLAASFAFGLIALVALVVGVLYAVGQI